ncbi:MAG: hypothetical protein ACLRIL_02090 [Fusicatenibacter saccharivorans]
MTSKIRLSVSASREAERKSLAGVGAQYDSELVYHNVRAEVAAQGVVYTDMESALNGEYADMVQETLYEAGETDMTTKFAALHGAVVVRRFVCLCAEGGFRGNPAAVVFPSECAGRRPVRAYADYCR